MSRSPLEIEYSELCEIIWNSNLTNKSNRINLLVNNLKSTYNISQTDEPRLKRQLTLGFLTQFVKKWNSVSRKQNLFKTKFSNFVKKKFLFDLSQLETSSTLNNIPNSSNALDKDGQMNLPQITLKNYYVWLIISKERKNVLQETQLSQRKNSKKII